MISFSATYLFAISLFIASCMILARQYWIFELFTHFVPQFLLLGSVTLLLLAMKRKWWMAMALLGIMFTFGLLYLKHVYPPASTRPTSGTIITVLEANVYKYNDQYEALRAKVQELQPTIIVLNEVNAEWIGRLKEVLGDAYVSFIELPSDDYRGMAVFSKLAIESYEDLRPTEESSPLLRIEMKDMPLVVYAVHPLSPITESWANQRNVYISRIGSMAATEEDDLIVVGDLNSTPFSPLFQDLLREGALKLASKGFGLSTTWRRGTPIAIAIDHVLYRGNMTVRGFDVLGEIGSDHRPILATIEFQE